MTRPIYEIAREISADWKKPYFGALPYISAMKELNLITDKYILERADGIILYFLANASSWRGEVAKRVKAELKAMVKEI